MVARQECCFAFASSAPQGLPDSGQAAALAARASTADYPRRQEDGASGVCDKTEIEQKLRSSGSTVTASAPFGPGSGDLKLAVGRLDVYKMGFRH